VSSEELGRLLSLVSHEVRAPLGVIRGYMRLLQQQGTEISESHRQAIAASMRAADRAAEILSQLSALARLHRREVMLTLKPAPLDPLLRAAVHEVVMPPEPLITIHVDDTPAVQVMADEAMARSAIAGFMTAVVRAQASDNRVHVRAREVADGNRPGISVSIVATDATNDTHEEQPLDILRGGLGLDLPLAAFILDAHGGNVREQRIDNRLNGFELWLPLADT
jgi:two-component system sensor histidine kinase ArlS